MQIKPSSSNDIQRIDADYLHDNVAWRKLPPPDTMLVVYPDTLASETTPFAPSVEPSGIHMPSSVPFTSTSTSTDVAAPSPAPISRPP